MSQKEQKTFGKIRSLLWPIHGYELKKLLPMFIMFFFISFGYNILRNMKDTLIVTAKSSGAEVIPFVKVWVMLPAAVLMTLVFVKLSNRYNRERVFYIMTSMFLSFFVVFAFIIFPNGEKLHAHKLANFLGELLPIGLNGFVAMVRYWSYTTFYVMAELWGSILLSLLFWGFANDITKVCEARRFYALFSIGANLACIICGQISKVISLKPYDPNLIFGDSAWEQSLMILVLIVMVCGVFLMGIFRWMHIYVLTDPKLCNQEKTMRESKQKIKISIGESLRFIATSKYLMSLAVIVVAYNVVINLIEVVWKAQIRQLYPLPAEYNAYMNQVTTITGLVAICIGLFVTSNVIRRFGWTFTAMITPVTLMVTSIVFFGLSLFGNHISSYIYYFFGTTPMILAAFVGSAQNIMSRAVKYTVFDTTKEIAFIPLDRETRIKGKSAIDGVLSRFGKSSGSMIHQSLLLTFGSLAVSAPYVAIILIVIISAWIVSTKKVGLRVDIKTREHEAVVAAETAK